MIPNFQWRGGQVGADGLWPFIIGAKFNHFWLRKPGHIHSLVWWTHWLRTCTWHFFWVWLIKFKSWNLMASRDQQCNFILIGWTLNAFRHGSMRVAKWLQRFFSFKKLSFSLRFKIICARMLMVFQIHKNSVLNFLIQAQDCSHVTSVIRYNCGMGGCCIPLFEPRATSKWYNRRGQTGDPWGIPHATVVRHSDRQQLRHSTSSL